MAQDLKKEDIPPLNNALVGRIVKRIRELKAEGYNLHKDKAVIVSEDSEDLNPKYNIEEIPISYLDCIGISYHLCEDDNALRLYREYQGVKVKNEYAQDYTVLGYIKQNDYANKLKSEG